MTPKELLLELLRLDRSASIHDPMEHISQMESLLSSALEEKDKEIWALGERVSNNAYALSVQVKEARAAAYEEGFNKAAHLNDKHCDERALHCTLIAYESCAKIAEKMVLYSGWHVAEEIRQAAKELK